MLVHLIESAPLDGSDPLENYRAIRAEVERYSPTLAERPELVVLSKIDLTGADETRARIEAELGREIFAISAVTGKGLPQLIQQVADLLETLPPTLDEMPDSVPPEAIAGSVLPTIEPAVEAAQASGVDET